MVIANAMPVEKNPTNNQADVSAQALLSAFELVDSAVALVDIASATMLASTGTFKQMLGSVNCSADWQSTLAASPELIHLCQSITQHKCPLHTTVAVNTEQMPIRLDYIETSIYLIALQPKASTEEMPQHQIDVRPVGLHEYMQKRDTLFTTSRTISVSEMATTLAHELNTPIGAISNLLRGAQMRLKKPDADLPVLHEELDKALEQARFTQNIISRIRDFTQSRRPKQQQLDLRKQVEEAVSLLDWLFTTSECKVQTVLPNKAVFVVGDATMMQQVFTNLLRNAVDAMQEQEVSLRLIQIHLSSRDNLARLQITDSGHGLKEGAADQLFVPFATNRKNGMGVGLNICRSFVELHQGKLWLSPNSDGGCTSHIELPLQEHALEKSDESGEDA